MPMCRSHTQASEWSARDQASHNPAPRTPQRHIAPPHRHSSLSLLIDRLGSWDDPTRNILAGRAPLFAARASASCSTSFTFLVAFISHSRSRSRPRPRSDVVLPWVQTLCYAGVTNSKHTKLLPVFLGAGTGSPTENMLLQKSGFPCFASTAPTPRCLDAITKHLRSSCIVDDRLMDRCRTPLFTACRRQEMLNSNRKSTIPTIAKAIILVSLWTTNRYTAVTELLDPLHRLEGRRSITVSPNVASSPTSAPHASPPLTSQTSSPWLSLSWPPATTS